MFFPHSTAGLLRALSDREILCYWMLHIKNTHEYKSKTSKFLKQDECKLILSKSAVKIDNMGHNFFFCSVSQLRVKLSLGF